MSENQGDNLVTRKETFVMNVNFDRITLCNCFFPLDYHMLNESLAMAANPVDEKDLPKCIPSWWWKNVKLKATEFDLFLFCSNSWVSIKKKPMEILPVIKRISLACHYYSIKLWVELRRTEWLTDSNVFCWSGLEVIIYTKEKMAIVELYQFTGQKDLVNL